MAAVAARQRAGGLCRLHGVFIFLAGGSELHAANNISIRVWAGSFVPLISSRSTPSDHG
ncbi:hypothetical protein ACLOJK_001260 [Asimina triloba]